MVNVRKLATIEEDAMAFEFRIGGNPVVGPLQWQVGQVTDLEVFLSGNNAAGTPEAVDGNEYELSGNGVNCPNPLQVVAGTSPTHEATLVFPGVTFAATGLTTLNLDRVVPPNPTGTPLATLDVDVVAAAPAPAPAPAPVAPAAGGFTQNQYFGAGFPGAAAPVAPAAGAAPVAPATPAQASSNNLLTWGGNLLNVLMLALLIVGVVLLFALPIQWVMGWSSVGNNAAIAQPAVTAPVAPAPVAPAAGGFTQNQYFGTGIVPVPAPGAGSGSGGSATPAPSPAGGGSATSAPPSGPPSGP